MTTFHSWNDVKPEIFDVDDLDAIAAGGHRTAGDDGGGCGQAGLYPVTDTNRVLHHWLW